MARLRHVIVLSLVGLGGCAGAQLRREPVGRWAAAVDLRGAAPAASGPSIQLARGRYELALHIDVPRAQLVEYAVACTPTGAAPIQLAGRVGETFEAYRAHRLAALNVQQDRARAAAATAANTIAGFVPPGAVTVGAQGAAGAPAGGPTAGGHVETTVSTQSVRYGATVSAEQAFPPITELQPGDVGAARLEARQTLMLPADATCVVRATAEDPAVVAAYDVTRVRDLGAEARERHVAAVSTARGVRVQLTTQLAAAGADPLALQHRREAEARARAEEQARRAQLQAAAEAERARRRAEDDARRAELRAAADAERERQRATADAERARRQAIEDAERARRQAIEDAERAKLQAAADAERARRDHEVALREEQRRHAELELRLQIEARLKLALEVRASLVAYLAGTCNADPNHLARVRAAELRVREERELRVRLELEARLKLEAKLRAEREAREARAREEREQRDAHLRAEREARLRIELQQREAREARERAEREAREAAERQRIEVALGVRGQLQAYLVSLGARQRPPMPALVAESPGSAPFDGARWSRGRWEWNAARWSWIWIAGGWTDSTVFGDAGSSGVTVVREVAVEVPAESPTVDLSTSGVGITVGASVSTSVSAHATSTSPTSTSPTSRPSQQHAPVVRDHRTQSAPPAATAPAPRVRDHRRR